VHGIHTVAGGGYIQGGKDPQATTSCKSFSAKEPLIVGLFCGKSPIKIRHALGLYHPAPHFLCRVEDRYINDVAVKIQ